MTVLLYFGHLSPPWSCAGGGYYYYILPYYTYCVPITTTLPKILTFKVEE